MSEQSEQFIFDNEGYQYMCVILNDELGFYVILNHQNQEVGRANCMLLSPEEMSLEDIIMDNEVVHMPKNLWIAILRKLFNFKIKPINYRRRGLGSELLKLVITHARQKGIKHIHGRVVKKDIANNSNLLQWYKKYGFKVGAATSEDKPGTVARIYMDIS